MGTRKVGLTDVQFGRPRRRWHLFAPLRYLQIKHPQKSRYDFRLPAIVALVCWLAYVLISPRVPLFGEAGLLKFARDLLVMAVPFMVGALASVAMGFPGAHIDKRPAGAELYLDGQVLSTRQFVCFLLGYLSFLGLSTLILAVGAQVLHGPISAWTADIVALRDALRLVGALVFAWLSSALIITTLWSLYFLTDIVNRSASP